MKLSEIYFKNIRGTSSSRVAVQLRCSKGMPYKKVYLENVYLYLSSSRGGSGEKQTRNRGSEAVSSFCRYVIAKYIGTQSPPPYHKFLLPSRMDIFLLFNFYALLWPLVTSFIHMGHIPLENFVR